MSYPLKVYRFQYQDVCNLVFYIWFTRKFISSSKNEVFSQKDCTKDQRKFYIKLKDLELDRYEKVLELSTFIVSYT